MDEKSWSSWYWLNNQLSESGCAGLKDSLDFAILLHYILIEKNMNNKLMSCNIYYLLIIRYTVL